MYSEYKDRVAFFVVYITEAHPTNIWQMQSNVKEGVLFSNPTTTAERDSVAQSCVRNLHIAIPALVDSIDNRVEQQYTGWPDRLYLIGTNGRVVYKSAPGPFGMIPAQLRSALERLDLHSQQASSVVRVNLPQNGLRQP